MTQNCTERVSSRGRYRIALVAALAAAATLAPQVVDAGDHGPGQDRGHGHDGPHLEFRGQAIVATGTEFAGTTVGGLSSITFDARRGVYYALSDDQGTLQPARFYTVRIDVADGTLDDGDVAFTGVTTLLAPDGSPYPAGSLDPEGLTLVGRDQLVVTSEGFANSGVAPWVRRYALDGTYVADLAVPDAFLPTGPDHGIRQNLAFEAAAVTPNGHHLLVGTEGALVQDGPAASVAATSPARIIRYDLRTGQVERQSVYVDDMVAEPPVPATAFAVNGLVELLPLDEQHAIAMERSFSVGAPGTGNTVKLYLVSFGGATNVDGLDSIGEAPRLRPVRKELMLDLRDLGLPLDNLEGMVFGPRLADGRRSIVLVSDNNFAPAQFTQFMLFALG